MNILYRILFFLKKSLDYGYKKIHREKILRKFNIHASVTFHISTMITGEGDISIGENSYLGTNTWVSSNPKGTSIRIGKDCAISHNVHIRTASYDVDKWVEGREMRKGVGKDIIIGNNVWIGANVFIAPGVSIGDNAILGANSFVNRDVPINSVVGGIPAKVIKNL